MEEEGNLEGMENVPAWKLHNEFLLLGGFPRRIRISSVCTMSVAEESKMMDVGS